jgi:serine/threonine protein kinase
MTAGSDLRGYPEPGEIIDGKYRIESLLGIGGMGAVAKATHLLRRASVALKFMSPLYTSFPGAADRFVNEAVAASRITSDHVVQIFDVGKLADGTPYLVMEYLEGLDLAQLLARDGRPGLPIQRALHFTMQILRALEAAHGAEIVHRDMKPSNCFVVRKDGQDDFVKLLDFGISKVTAPDGVSLTLGNVALGTPLYMSPEQARSPRDVDARGDIYSVGGILYELLSGRTPFITESGQVSELFAKLFSDEPPPIASLCPEVPPELASAIHTALARDRGARFPTVVHFAEALAPFIGPETQPVLTRIRQDVPVRLSLLLGREPVPTSTTAVGGTPRFVLAPAGSPAAAPRRGAEATAETQYASVPPPAPLPGPAVSLPVPRASDPIAVGATIPLLLTPVATPVAARTDLGAVADAAPAKPGRSPAFALGLGALALAGLLAAGWWLRSGSDGTAPTPTAAAVTPPPTLTAVAEPAPSAAIPSPEVTPSASAATPLASPAPSAAPRPKTSAPQTGASTGAPPPPNPRSNPLDIKPIE